MIVCKYCKTTFNKKAFFCRNCSKPILNENCCQIYHPLLTDKNKNLPFNFEVVDEGIFYFEKEFDNYEMEDVNYYIQVNEIIKFLYFFCEKTKYEKFVMSMTIEGDGQLIEPIDFISYEHKTWNSLNKLDIDLKNSLKWTLDIYRALEGIFIKKIKKIRVRLERILIFD